MPGATNRLAWTLGSLVAFVVLWELAAVAIDSRVLPTPVAVMDAFNQRLEDGELVLNVGITLARVAVSFVLAMAIGSAIGLVMGRSAGIDRFFDGWLILLLNLPALVTIILCYVWFGLTEVAAVLAVAINKIPNVAVTLREGARALDRDYLEMAEVYRLGRWKTLRHVVLPELLPFFAAAMRSGLALIWKIVLVVELLGRSNGVGFELNLLFQLFDVAGILAYTLAFVLVVQAIELFGLQPWERYVNRWRR
ncbi:MAG: ABC transporter permease [Alphaproteobacteria bacterium]|nr:ABC transporter permease [Alphaproteobacteria bacterium]